MPRTYKRFCFFISLWLIHIFSSDVYGQNLVVNGSFEEYSTYYCDRRSSNFDQIDTLPAIGWYSLDKGEPEYYRTDTILSNCRVETDLWYFKPELFSIDHSVNGKAWMGICLFVWDGYSERITGEIKKSLLQDSIYLISFYIRITDISLYGINTIGIQFSNNISSIYGMIDPYYSAHKFQINQPDIEFDISNTCNTGDWVRISGLYKAKGGEKIFTIGYYYPDGINWTKAFNIYNTWIFNGTRNAYHASRKLVRRTSDLDFSSIYVKEISEHEISYYYIDNIEISQYLE